MIIDSKTIVDAFEKLSEEGNGVLAVPPQNEEERVERDRLMQEYLLQHKPNMVSHRGKSNT